MKKLFSAKYTEGTISAALLILRLGMGIIMMYHGYDRVVHFNSKEYISMNFMGIGRTVSQVLIIIVELGGAFFITIGLCTRAAAVLLILWLTFVLFKSFGGDIFEYGEKIALYTIGFVALFTAGPGNYSADKKIYNSLFKKSNLINQ